MFILLAINVVLLWSAPTYVTYGNQRYPALVSTGPDGSPTLFGETAFESSLNNTCSTHTYVPTMGGGSDKTREQWPAYWSPTAPSYSQTGKQCDAHAPMRLYMFTAMVGDASHEFYTNSRLFEPVDSSGGCGSVSYGAPCLPRGMVGQPTNCRRIGGNGGEVGFGPCTPTRVSTVLNSFFFNFAFLGWVYFGAIWITILVFFVGLIRAACNRRRSRLQSAIYDINDDMNDSDDDYAAASFSWNKK